MTDFWNHLRQVWTNTDWSWIVLWLGLTMLILALVVLMRTRWGQSQPVGKCAVLSLVAHLLLAVYATTVQIVTGSAGREYSEPLRATLLDSDEWNQTESFADRPVYQSASRSGAPAFWPIDSHPARVRIDPLDPTRLEPTGTDALPADEPSHVAGLSPPLMGDSPKPAIDTPAPAPQPAEPIDQPQPTANVPVAVAPELATLERMALTEPKASSNHAIENSADHLAPTTAGSGIADPLTKLQSDTQFKAGDGSPFRAARSPASAIVNLPSDDASQRQAESSSNSGDGASSLLVPVKTMNEAANAAVPQIYRDRTAGDRAAVARRRGGSPEAEAAVQAALRWLAANQSADGRWDADRFGAGEERTVLGHDRQGAGARADTATTGLALLAFLGAGHTHVEGKYKETVKRGLEHLLNAQAADGNLGGDAELFAFMYSHGIATLALSEAYAMTTDKRLAPALRAAIGFTVAAQHPTTGGWRYRSNDPGDTSQLGWQLMALKSAELSGLAMRDQTRQGMLRFLRSVSSGNHGGLASYRPREQVTRPMTAEALVCRQFLGMTRDNPAANEAGDYMLGGLPSGQEINLYYWYYGTLAMYQLQGDHWRKWNDALQNTLVQRQVATGDQAGSWDPDCLWAGYGGRVYSTAMAALCLEVYYRYLPLYGDLAPELREAKRPQAR